MEAGDDRSIFLSTLPATSRDRTIAAGVVIASAIFFAATLPFSQVPLPAVPAFVASYQSALGINDLITAILLLSQFSLLRSRALLALASGYLFTAVAAVVHGLTFPNLFAAGGLLNAGSADHGLALYGLARRLPALRARLRPAQGQGRRQRNQGIGWTSDRLGRDRGLCRDGGRALPGDGAASVPANAHHRPRLHAGFIWRRADGMAHQSRSPDRAVAAAPSFGARRLGHGGAVRLAV